MNRERVGFSSVGEQFVGVYCWACRYSRPHPNIDDVIKCLHQDVGSYHNMWFGCSYGEQILPDVSGRAETARG